MKKKCMNKGGKVTVPTRKPAPKPGRKPLNLSEKDAKHLNDSLKRTGRLNAMEPNAKRGYKSGGKVGCKTKKKG